MRPSGPFASSTSSRPSSSSKYRPHSTSNHASYSFGRAPPYDDHSGHQNAHSSQPSVDVTTEYDSDRTSPLPLHNMEIHDASGARARGPGSRANTGGAQLSKEAMELMGVTSSSGRPNGRLADAKSDAGPGGASKEFGRYGKMIPVEGSPKTPVEQLQRLLTPLRSEWGPLIIYTLLALITRLAYIGASNTVVWDEAHFGKFGSHYLKREFYFDVHPPLGKMLVGLAGLLSGYDGSYDFKSGSEYPKEVPYTTMRVLMAMFGIGMVPLAWSTSGGLGWNWRARHLVTIMVLCDNAWLTISRFILLDSMLLFFTFATVHGMVMFHGERKRPFTFEWYFWLSLTGLMIGCVTSVKWVGLFATAVVGLYTIEDLWDKFGDLKMPKRVYVRHWFARAACLIVLPILVYMISFKIHFLVLNHTGPGDAQMSSLFQANLVGNDFNQNPLDAAFGSKVTLKNMGYGGGLLHSHVQTYPVGSQQQQVTCYHYKDENNEWIITPTWDEPTMNETTDPIRFLKHGDTIRLVHVATNRNLHSHPVAAPITKANHEVAGYGDKVVGDSNDHWIVEVVDDMHKGTSKDRIHSLTSRLRFRHQNLGCYLRAANAVLPQWGWKQIEVSCDKENNPKDEHTYWNIESHWNDRLPKGQAKLYKSPFLRDFWHLNVAMMTSNNALIPDPDKEDILASGPTDWPFLHVGLRMNGWGDQMLKYYLLGNPIIWIGGTISLFMFCALLAWYLMRRQRRYNDLSPAEWNQFVFVGKLAMSGWLLHYLPFLIMGRVTYIHHYLPTLYFAVLMTGHVLDHLFFNSYTARVNRGGRKVPLSERFKNVVFASCLVAVVGVFWWFRGVSYGMDGPMLDHWGLRWRKNWNIYP